MRARQLFRLAPLLAALAACGAPSTSPAPTSTPSASAGPVFTAVNPVKPAPIYGLAVSFEETGLRPGEAVDYQAGAEIVLTFSCGAAVQTVTSPLAFNQRYSANGAGTVSGLVSMQMKPPVCPSGDGLRPLRYQIQNGVLTDTTHGQSVRLPDSGGQFD